MTPSPQVSAAMWRGVFIGMGAAATSLAASYATWVAGQSHWSSMIVFPVVAFMTTFVARVYEGKSDSDRAQEGRVRPSDVGSDLIPASVRDPRPRPSADVTVTTTTDVRPNPPPVDWTGPPPRE